MSKKIIVLVWLVITTVATAIAIYTFIPRNSVDSGMCETLFLDDMAYSKSYGLVFAKHENYNGEFVLYIEGLHRIVFAVPMNERTTLSGKPDVSIKLRKDLLIYGNIMVYGNNQYTILEYGSYTLPPRISELILSGEVRAFTSQGRELTDVKYDSFPILDAIALYRVSPLIISPYANYIIYANECWVYDNTVEYVTRDGSSVVFHADTMEFAYSTNLEIDQAYREGEPDHDEE